MKYFIALILALAPYLSYAACDCGVGTEDPTQTCTGQSISYTRADSDETEYTITYNFQCGGSDCQCGQFANLWDFWVAPTATGGSVTITSVTPTASGDETGVLDTYRDGSQYGPVVMDSLNGFDGRHVDSRFGDYDSDLHLEYPLVVTPDTVGHPVTILKAIHEDTLCTSEDRICLKYVEPLTIVDTPPGNVFRPAYFGSDKTMYSAASWNPTSILSTYDPTTNSISWADAYEVVKSIHPQHHIENQNLRQGYTAKINTQSTDGYDGYYALRMGTVLLKLTQSTSSEAEATLKDLVARGITQLGIDLWAIHSEGGDTNPSTGAYNFESVPCGAFTAQGGFNNLRLGPILFANALLGQTWTTILNNTFSTLNGRNCFAETGWVVPTSVTSIGKNVPLFGNQLGNLGIYNYTEGSNCNIIATDMLTDTGYGTCGTPSAYQTCCTHGPMLGEALAIWLTPTVYNQYPSNASDALDYIYRARNIAPDGNEFGSYSDPESWAVTGFTGTYNRDMFFEMWDENKTAIDSIRAQVQFGSKVSGSTLIGATIR